MPRDQAEAAVLCFESRIQRQLRGFSPESFAVQVARLFRMGQVDVEVFRQYPPHFLIHSLEANCAYYQQYRYRPLDAKEFAATINLWLAFDDPVLNGTLKDGTHLFEFVQYMHRTQIEVQKEASHILFGRGIRMFAEAAEMPEAAAAFAERYGLTARDWIKLVLLFHARTGESSRNRLAFSGLRRQALESLPELGISIKSLDAFLGEASRTWQEIGAAYREVRELGTTNRRFGPLTWGQRRPTLAKYPIMRMGMEYLVPAPPLLLRQITDGLFERFDLLQSERVRSDIGKQFERYVRDILRFHLPDRALVEADALKFEGEKSCDFAVDLPDAVLLIECKAVMLDRALVTERAVINSGAIQRLLDGYVQIVRTAARIKCGGYSANLIPREKPVIGLVVTLGNVPGADNGAVLDATMERYRKELVSDEAVQCLTHRPQPFDAEAFEYFVLLLRSGVVEALKIFSEKLAANPWHVGEWATFLNKRIQDRRPVDLTFWKQPVDAMIEEVKLRKAPSA